MNTFGRIFRISMFGESHGKCVGLLIDGCPAGIALSEEDFLPDLQRRMAGAKGTTPRREPDVPVIMAGVFNGKTTGAPITIIFENKNIDSSAYDKIKTTPRPGHADLVAFQKFGGFNDYRGGGHFSGRLTICLVAAGAVAKKILSLNNKIQLNSKLIEAGGSTEIENSINEAVVSGDSIGGVVECTVNNLPAGLGEPFFDSAESLISHAVFAIPAIKGIEFGAGFASSRMKGSECNDNITDLKGSTETNNSGGINGGITNGNPLIFRIAVKPTSSIKKIKKTVELKTGEQTEISVGGRHDACIALRVPVILEAVTAFVLADLMLLQQSVSRVVK